MLVRIEHHEMGRRLWIFERRSHHYHAGFALIALGLKLIWQDRWDLLRRPRP